MASTKKALSVSKKMALALKKTSLAPNKTVLTSKKMALASIKTALASKKRCVGLHLHDAQRPQGAHNAEWKPLSTARPRQSIEI